jgi:hypothetical protein
MKISAITIAFARDLAGKTQVPSSGPLEAALRKVPISTCNANRNCKAVGFSVQVGGGLCARPSKDGQLPGG